MLGNNEVKGNFCLLSILTFLFGPISNQPHCNFTLIPTGFNIQGVFHFWNTLLFTEVVLTVEKVKHRRNRRKENEK